MTTNDTYHSPVPTLNDELCEFDSCSEPAIYRCFKCARCFCLDHSSDVEPQKFCIKCLGPADHNVLEMPLIDAEGTRHEGRILRPIGGGFTDMNKLISDMDALQLEAFILDYTSKLIQAENQANFYRINLSAAQNYALEKKLAKQRTTDIGGVQFVNPVQKQRQKTSRKPKTETDKFIEMFAKLGFTPEQIQAMFEEELKKKAKGG